MHRHLVAIEVGVICATNKWVQLDRLTLNQHRLKRLDSQTVQGGCTIQHDRMLSDHVGQNVPNLGGFVLDHLFGGLNRGRQLSVFQSAKYERLEEF